MDEDWVIERLEWWIKTARAARVTSYSSQRGTRTLGFMCDTHKSYESMRAVASQTHAVICRVLNRDSAPSLMNRTDNTYWVDEGIELAEHALSVVKTSAETRAKLGSAAPTMAADALHPLIWGAASKHWNVGHYSAAVQRAATMLNADVQDRVGRHDASDSTLMQQTFSTDPPKPEASRLRWPGEGSDLTVKAMRQGIFNLSQGVFSAIRNPATHSTEDMERQEALEQLATLSILARWIERCELVTA